MIKEAFGYGDTIDEARRAALKELGVADDQTEFDIGTEILEQPEKKLFGLFGGKQARVRVYYEIEDPVEAEEVAVKEEIKPEKTEIKNLNGENPSKKAADYLQTIVDALGVENSKITVTELENGAEFCLEGQKMGLVIGRRGETLDAIQYLTSLVANHANGSYYRVSINTGDYREKRDVSLNSLAKRAASLAIKYNKNISIEPMNPYERRIIHTAIQEIEGVNSWSVGENEKRHVVVGPTGLNEGEDGQPITYFEKRKKQGYNGNRGGYNKNRNGGYNNNRGGNRGGRGGYNNRGGYNKNRSYNSYNRNSSTESGNIVDVERKPKNEAVSAPLYGKIEIDK